MDLCVDKGSLDLVGSRIVHIHLSLSYKLINRNSFSSYPFLQHSCYRNSREHQGKFFAFAHVVGKVAPHILWVGKIQPLKWLLRAEHAASGAVVSQCIGHFRWLFLFMLGTFKAAALPNQCSRCLFSPCLERRISSILILCQPLKKHVNVQGKEVWLVLSADQAAGVCWHSPSKAKGDPANCLKRVTFCKS